MKKLLQTPLLMLVALVAIVGMQGCHIHDDCDYCGSPPPPPPCTYGPNGDPGPAFFGLDWTNLQPTYVWCNNTAIPQVFQYGTYYNSYPGTYHLYYEGSYYDGCCPVEYYWDVDFVVWVNAGTAGGCGYIGTDGVPSYLMLVMAPNGPGEVRTNKTAKPGTTMQVLKETKDEVKILYTKGDLNVEVTYKRLTESRKGELDPAKEITPGKVK